MCRFILNTELKIIVFLFFTTALANRVMAQVPIQYLSNTTVNYVRTWDATAPETSDSTLITRPLKDVKMITQYIDGLGRPLQTVIKQGSLETGGTTADMVSAIVYDEFGRESKKYLPFAANNTGTNTSVNDGLFKLNPFQQQATFMTEQYGAQGETYFYSKTNFEPSPLNRVEKYMPPGNSWVGNNVGIEMKYWLNTVTDNVRIWNVNNNSGGFGSYTSTSTYATGELYKNIIADENGAQVIEFKDKEGNVILKKVQLSATPDPGAGSGYTGWLCTYYIYDDLNNLRCVVQPRGVELISPTWSLADATILEEQCFRYEYDERNRMVMKKVPGAGEVWMVYDVRDRLVLSQDANLRAQGKWMYTLYDILNRPEISGLWTNSNDRIFHKNNASASISYPDLSGQTVEELSKTFYDNYMWVGGTGSSITADYNSSINTYLQSASDISWPYPQANTQSVQVKGMLTGTKIKVLGTSSTYLYSVSFYDQKGRVIQVQSTNITGGVDILTTQYTWAGQPLVMVQLQQNAGEAAQTNIVVSKMTYDDLGRITKTEKKISNSFVNSGAMPGYKIITQNEYNKLGQLEKKKLAPDFNSTGLETIDYDYTIRGWLLGANRAYLATTGQNGSTKFGFELGYDKSTNISGRGFTSTQLNGNINGMIWKSDGDDVKRKYDYSYDAANRLMNGIFEQDDAINSWNSTTMDYTVQMGNSNSQLPAYDANGNIKAMKQYGWKLGSPGGIIDDLTYNYMTNSNKLLNVIDASNVPLTKLGDFRTSALHPVQNKTVTTVDYTYDANGNLKKDLNKDIGTSGTEGVTYNYLNLPQTITVRKTGGVEKGTINYTYDAAGNKLKKVATEFGGTVRLSNIDYTTDVTTTTTYIAGFVYEKKIYSNSDLASLGYADKLQFAGHEEGRIRFNEAVGTTAASMEYDYLLKDHLGNVRMVLTEEQRTDGYLPASMELGKETLEEKLYANLPDTKIDKPSGYPNDAYTNPNDRVAKTGSFKKIGPAITLRVMAGDKLNLRASSYYKTGGVPIGTPEGLLSDLVAQLTGSIGNITGNHGGSTATEIAGSGVFVSGATNFLNNTTYDQARPKAYLN